MILNVDAGRCCVSGVTCEAFHPSLSPNRTNLSLRKGLTHYPPHFLTWSYINFGKPGTLSSFIICVEASITAVTDAAGLTDKDRIGRGNS